MSVDDLRGKFIRGGAFVPLVDEAGQVYDASALFRGDPTEHLGSFREIVERLSAERSVTQNSPSPRTCISFPSGNYSLAREIATRLNSATNENGIKQELLKAEIINEAGDRRFSLISDNPTQFLTISGMEMAYAMFEPKPNPEDEKIAQVLKRLGIIDPDPAKYSLLTIGPPTGALTDSPTEEIMRKILRESRLTPHDFYTSGIVETTYIIFADGRVAKFITLPLPVLGRRALGIFDDTKGILEYTNAISTVTDFDECRIIPNVLVGFNRTIIESSNTQPH